jgi:hypothetical protein
MSTYEPNIRMRRIVATQQSNRLPWLRYRRFRRPIYAVRWTTELVPGLSILDPTVNCGIEEPRGVARSNPR